MNKNFNLINSKTVYYLAGLLLIAAYFLPYFILGENAYYRIHDYIEQDFVYIKLNAKYLLSPFTLEIPELFGGTFRGSIQEHSLIQIILYKFFQGVSFLKLNLFLTSFIGYTGMFLLINKLHKNETKTYLVSLIASFLFSISPVLLHGATVMFLPFFVYLLIVLYKNETSKFELPLSLLLSFLIGIGTSLVYGGFCFLSLLLIFSAVSFIKNKNFWKKYLINFFVMLTGYIISFFYTFLSLKEISHRINWTVEAEGNLFKVFFNYFLYGNGEIRSFHIIALILSIIFLIICIFNKNPKTKRTKKYILITIALLAIVSLFSACYTSLDFILALREKMNVFKSIQLSRISYFILPIGSFLLATSTIGFLNLIESAKIKYKKVLIFILLSAIFIPQYFIITTSKYNKACKYTYKLLRGKQIPEKTFKEFFDEKTMTEIKNHINLPENEYRVVSIGFNPAVPLYNGMYCLDGYSTNYRNSYKENFRKVIEKALNENETSRKYYDEWGSRVYITTANTEYFGVSKAPDSSINFKALKNLGCNYIISIFPLKIKNEKIKLEKTFNSTSYGKFYLYKFE